MPLLHAARSTIGGGLKVTLGRSGTVPSGEAILRISARTTKRASLPLLVCGVARTRDARRSASGAASAVLKPIIAATCAAMFLMFDRPFRQPRFDTTAATKESDEPSRPRAGGASNFASQPRFWAFSDGFAFHGSQTAPLLAIRRSIISAAMTHQSAESDSKADSLAVPCAVPSESV